jgi:hypothetical protein
MKASSLKEGGSQLETVCKYESSVGVRIDHLLFSPIQILLLISLYTTSPQQFALAF